MRRHLAAAGFALTIQLAPGTLAAPSVEARGLMRDMAVLVIDGRQQLLRVGERSGAVELLAADPGRARVRIGDEVLELGLTERVGGTFVAPDKREVRVTRDGQGHFRVAGTIAGKPVSFLVDTGATVLAMSSEHADRLGIDYRSETPPMQVVTAAGPAPSWYVELDLVEVGGIQVRGVQAAVVEGAYPVDVLLGMSFLRNVELSERAGVLTLTQDF
ncbi:MAG: TIGR02281 family clan AA aspartic protease [Pseudomonadales bacterium]|jgi:aspartyl protease family protein|nr:TIGR02281 family clan AA aspartic protease [Pseudomonadales bacterium]